MSSSEKKYLELLKQTNKKMISVLMKGGLK